MSPQGLDSDHNPNTVSDFGDTDLLKNILVTVQKSVAVDIIVSEHLAVFATVDRFQPFSDCGLVPLLDEIEIALE
jgi:hypothetical protein